MESNQQSKSTLVDDESIRNLLNWVTSNGGLHRVQVMQDENGVRGLYSSQSFNIDSTISDYDENSDVIVKIPNKLIITPYHVQNLHYVDKDNKSVLYKDLFVRHPELFDPKYEYRYKHTAINKKKLENEYAEYFQLTFFLITERLKGKCSPFEPFITYLPQEIHTLYTYPDDTKIHPNSSKTLIEEIQYKDDDIYDKIKQDREYHQECKDRFLKFIKENTSELNKISGMDFSIIDEELFDWGWMNVGTRCFGTHHFPSSIAMVPLIDLINHHTQSEKMRFYLFPLSLGIKMLERGDTAKINQELEIDYENDNQTFYQDMKLEWESQDLDQHWDDYADFYYNYKPIPKEPKVKDEDEESETDEDKFIQLDPMEKVWDLKNEKIFISKKLLNKKTTQIQAGEQLHISYGERSNSFLLIEYGFTIPDNRYDFVRVKDIDVKLIQGIAKQLKIECIQDTSVIQKNFDELNMNGKIRVDLKFSGIHRDVIRMIRSTLPKQTNDAQVLKIYKALLQQRVDQYPTSLIEDRELLKTVENNKDYHWMYQYILIYRIGQKEILQRQQMICDMLIEIFEKNQTITYDDLLEKVGTLKESTNMSDYFQDYKLTYLQ